MAEESQIQLEPGPVADSAYSVEVVHSSEQLGSVAGLAETGAVGLATSVVAELVVLLSALGHFVDQAAAADLAALLAVAPLAPPSWLDFASASR